MFPRLVLLFTLIPALEIYLLIKIGSGLGAANTLLLIIATGVVGAHYARRQGIEVVRRFQSTLAQGRPPGIELVDGALLLLGGALLITPGFLTDAVGFSLVFPPAREFWKRWAVDWIRRKVERGEIVIRQ